MESFRADNLNTLKARLAVYGDAFLFRGQTREHNLPDGTPNLTSSFSRLGCIPPKMLKWAFYTDELLRRGGFDVARPDALAFVQGLLQHYGWRSFFVDLTADAAVASWFASHVFEAQSRYQLCENATEQPVMLRLQTANYNDHLGDGQLYVLNKDALRAANHELVNIVDELTTDCPSRFHTQKAWLASIYRHQTRLEPAAIVARIEAPAAVFREHAQSANLDSTNSVFPSPEEDQLLANLLGLPRLRIPLPGAPFPFYQRSLDIPEYQDSFTKHLPPSTALYTPFWISDAVAESGNETWIHVPEEAFYGNIEIGEPTPRVCEFLTLNAVTNFETDELICYPTMDNNITYEKGISIRRKAENLFEICSISIDYKSDRLVGIGVSRGYMYELVKSRFVRKPSELDCPCGDPARHALHLRALAVIDDMLNSAAINRQGNVIRVTYGSDA